MYDENAVREALKAVVDPELGINVVDLGLIYGIACGENGVTVTMSMTSAACPMHNLLSQLAEDAVRQCCGDDTKVSVEVVFDPPWSPDMMSEEARRLLG